MHLVPKPAARGVAAMWICLACGPALAGASPWANAEHSQTRLISANEGVGDSQVLRLGVHIRLDEGWGTYWRAPGDAGLPPLLDWSQSGNIDGIVVDWPAPRRFLQYGFATFGYVDEVVLPVNATLAAPNRPVRIRLDIVYAACREVCYLVEKTLALDIPATPAGEDPVVAALLDRYHALVPATRNSPALAIDRVLAGEGGAAAIEVVALSAEPFSAPDVIVEGPPGYSFQAPEVRLTAGGTRAVLRSRFTATSAASRPLAGQFVTVTVTVTVFDGARAIERNMPVLPAD